MNAGLSLLAGAAGIEPANADTKNRCLTAWRRSIKREAVFIESSRTCKALFPALADIVPGIE